MNDLRLVAQTRSLGLVCISASFLPHFCLTRRFFAASSGKSVRESSVGSAMSIEHEPRNTLQAPLGAAWVWFKAWRSRYLQRSTPCRSYRSLLVPSEDGRCCQPAKFRFWYLLVPFGTLGGKERWSSAPLLRPRCGLPGSFVVENEKLVKFGKVLVKFLALFDHGLPRNRKPDRFWTDFIRTLKLDRVQFQDRLVGT